MPAKLDFSFFILQFNFFNGFSASERHPFTENPYFGQLAAFSSRLP
jgi:hypothetical protein